MEITDAHWEIVKPILVARAPRKNPWGRKPRDPRPVRVVETANGPLWKDLPPRFPPYQTCHWRRQAWVKERRLDPCPRPGRSRWHRLFGGVHRDKARQKELIADYNGLPVGGDAGFQEKCHEPFGARA